MWRLCVCVYCGVYVVCMYSGVYTCVNVYIYMCMCVVGCVIYVACVRVCLLWFVYGVYI
jgi:hypothetical protein